MGGWAPEGGPQEVRPRLTSGPPPRCGVEPVAAKAGRDVPARPVGKRRDARSAAEGVDPAPAVQRPAPAAVAGPGHHPAGDVPAEVRVTGHRGGAAEGVEAPKTVQYVAGGIGLAC